MEVTNRFRIVNNPLNNPALFIKCLDITEDLKFAFLWVINNNHHLTIIKDQSNTSETATTNLFQMGFGFTD